MMGLGRRQGPDGGELTSLLEVSKRRLPVYTVLLEAVVLVGLVVSVVRTIELGECACLKSIVHFIDALAEYLNSYVSGAVLMCGAAEGVIVGLAELRRKQSNQRVRQESLQEGRLEGRQEGRQETIQEAIEVLERVGNAEAARTLRERLARDER